MLNTPLEPHPSLFIYHPLVSVEMFDHLKYPSQYQIAYSRSNQKWVTMKMDRDFPPNSKPNNSPSQAIARATITPYNIEGIGIGDNILS